MTGACGRLSLPDPRCEMMICYIDISFLLLTLMTSLSESLGSIWPTTDALDKMRRQDEWLNIPEIFFL